MRLYHTTFASLADLIIQEGFDDRSFIDGGRQTDGRRGVWFTDEPSLPFEHPDGKRASVICVDLPEKVAERYQVDERYGADDWREWHGYLVPSAVLNAHPVERFD